MKKFILITLSILQLHLASFAMNQAVISQPNITISLPFNDGTVNFDITKSEAECSELLKNIIDFPNFDQSKPILLEKITLQEWNNYVQPFFKIIQKIKNAPDKDSKKNDGELLQRIINDFQFSDAQLGQLITIADFFSIQELLNAGFEVALEKLVNHKNRYVHDENPFNLTNSANEILLEYLKKKFDHKYQVTDTFPAKSSVNNIAFNSQGNLLASVHGKITNIFNMQTKKLLQSIKCSCEKINAITFHPTKNILVLAGQAATYFLTSIDPEIGKDKIIFWDIENAKEINTSLVGDVKYCTSLLYLNKGTMLSAAMFGSIKQWNIEAKELIHDTFVSGYVTSMACNPEETVFALGCLDGRVLIFDTKINSVTDILKGHTETKRINAVCFNSTGTIIASASQDNTIKLWDAQTKQLLHTLALNQNRISSIAPHPTKNIAFHPTKDILASASTDKTIKLWDAQTGALLQTLENYVPVTAITFNSDGTIIAAGTSEGLIKIWSNEWVNKIQTIPDFLKALEI